MEFITFLDNTLNQALVYVFLALSVYISLRLLDFPDLSVEGTFPLGAAVAASIAKYTGMVELSIPMALLSGFIMGTITASLNIYLNIGKLLSGILVAIGLYSINFRIMGARANIYLNPDENLFYPLRKADQWVSLKIFGEQSPVLLYPVTNTVLVLFLILMLILLYKFFKTEKGALIRYARSENKFFYEALGINYKIYVIIGLGIANALAALSGALAAFSSGSASVTMGFGIILVALVALVIGEQLIYLFHKDLTDLWPVILAPFLGTFLYFGIIKAVNWLNTLWQSYRGYPDPTDQLQFFNSDIRLLSALIMIVMYLLRRDKQSSINLPERL